MSKQRLRLLVVDFGEVHSTGACFVRALRALGHEVRFFDQAWYFPARASLASRVAGRLVKGLSVGFYNAAMVAAAAAFRPHVVLVMKGSVILPQTIERLRLGGAVTAVFQNDDVENPISSTWAMVEGLPQWDVVFTPRRFALDELRARGARRVEVLPFSYDPALHHPAAPSAAATDLDARAVFVGTWAPERTEPFTRLHAAGVPLAVHGNGWRALPSGSPLLAGVVRPVVTGEALREKLTYAGAALCLLRKGNRDWHTMRSFEIPACEGFMVAERTSDHLRWFEDGKEAVFFEGTDELLEVLARWLPDRAGRRAVAAAGRRRLLADSHRYADRAATMLRVVDELRR
jgi:spore maturation protein CgeB